MRLQPVVAAVYVGNEGDFQGGDGLHSLADKGAYLVEFCGDGVDDNLVVDLHNHL